MGDALILEPLLSVLDHFQVVDIEANMIQAHPVLAKAVVGNRLARVRRQIQSEDQLTVAQQAFGTKFRSTAVRFLCYRGLVHQGVAKGEKSITETHREFPTRLAKHLATCTKRDLAICRVALAASVALVLVLMSACVGEVAERPAETAAPATFPPVLTQTPEHTELPTSSPFETPTTEPSGSQEPLSEITPTANPKMEAIGLAWSFIGLHNNGDNFYLHVVVMDDAYQFEPETIEVIDPATGQSVGPYELNDRQDTNVCPQLVEDGRVFWTEGIDASQLPPVFQDFITYDPRIFRLTIREITGESEVIDFVEPPGVCESVSE